MSELRSKVHRYDTYISRHVNEDAEHLGGRGEPNLCRLASPMSREPTICASTRRANALMFRTVDGGEVRASDCEPDPVDEGCDHLMVGVDAACD